MADIYVHTKYSKAIEIEADPLSNGITTLTITEDADRINTHRTSIFLESTTVARLLRDEATKALAILHGDATDGVVDWVIVAYYEDNVDVHGPFDYEYAADYIEGFSEENGLQSVVVQALIPPKTDEG